MKLCECGCGEHAPISPVNHKRLGYVKGEPRRYIRGHAMRGKTHTKEARRKIRENSPTFFKKGHKPLTDGKNLLKYQKGKDHWNWKGGINPDIVKTRSSIKMKRWREAIFERDDYTCQKCKSRGCKLNADHYPYPFSVVYKTKNDSLMWDINNGRTLCVNCHNKTKTYWKDYYEQNS